MVTLSLTRSRIASVLRGAAEDVRERGWSRDNRSLIFAIDAAAGYIGLPDTPEEELSVAAWDALADHLGMDAPEWEATQGRTQDDVLAALEAAAQAVAR
jgi:hypothetical protein